MQEYIKPDLEKHGRWVSGSPWLKPFDRSEIIVPNADLMEQKVTNWTFSSKMVRVTLLLFGKKFRRPGPIREESLVELETLVACEYTT